jgi:hypothetical protein
VLQASGFCPIRATLVTNTSTCNKVSICDPTFASFVISDNLARIYLPSWCDEKRSNKMKVLLKLSSWEPAARCLDKCIQLVYTTK